MRRINYFLVLFLLLFILGAQILFGASGGEFLVNAPLVLL